MNYFDCTKFDYRNSDPTEIEHLTQRDKSAYKHSLLKWIQDELDHVTDRKWQIENIGIVEETGDFIRLIKEAELTYSLGAFYSTIALSGIASEDLCKYYAAKANQNDLIELTQNQRLNKLRSRSILDEDIYLALNEIRKLRNDCLHFNEDFKTRDQAALGKEALACINRLKSIYKKLFSSPISSHNPGTLIKKVIEDFAQQQASRTSFGDTLNEEEFAMKLRYFVYKELNFDIAISNPGDRVVHTGLFQIIDTDLTTAPKEITLQPDSSFQYVTIDVNEDNIQKLRELDLHEGDTIYASIYSVLDHQGISAIWHLERFERADS